MDPALQQPIHDAVQQGLDSLPVSAHSMVVAALMGGVVMWLAGRHVLRLAFVLVGMAGGALTAHLLLPLVSTAIPPIAAIILGALLGGILSFFAFRVAIAIWLALIGSVLATGICIVVVGISMPEPPETPLTLDEMLLPGIPLEEDEPDPLFPLELPNDDAESDDALEPETIQPMTDAERAAMERVRDFARHLADEGRRMWNDIPSSDRLKLVSSTLLGFAGGALLGFFAPKRSAAILTATIGAAVVMASGVWLASAASIEPPKLPIPVYVLVWIVLSAVGMKVQFMGHKKPADNDD